MSSLDIPKYFALYSLELYLIYLCPFFWMGLKHKGQLKMTMNMNSGTKSTGKYEDGE